MKLRTIVLSFHIHHFTKEKYAKIYTWRFNFILMLISYEILYFPFNYRIMTVWEEKQKAIKNFHCKIAYQIRFLIINCKFTTSHKCRKTESVNSR